MIKEIQAKTILNHVKQPDTWFGLRYNLNLYRGCQHQCIYCDSRSDCYQIENFADILVKTNAIDILKDELPRKRKKGTIGFGSMNDPYMPIEMKWQLTRRALEVINANYFPVHILTKSALVLRDFDILREIAKQYAAISFSVTTADDLLGKKLEPGASLVSERFSAMRTIAKHGITTGVLMMPILPYLEDTKENIEAIIRKTAGSGGMYILSWFGLTMRSGQREYFYAKLDELFPGIKQKYIAFYGEQYRCGSPHARELYEYSIELCREYGLENRIPHFNDKRSTQGQLFETLT